MENETALAELCYVQGIKEQLEAKYKNRIEYLVQANNELMRALEQSEADLKEVVEVEKEVPRMTDNGNEEELAEEISYDKEF